ncbi:hypothetical protein [Streptomyces sp. NPDC101393]|uniref:hypothetical protein n=1 Tax=Streptomyces sp. NPDC101393 TaxID=3366141 RepID=UPI0037FFD6AA
MAATTATASDHRATPVELPPDLAWPLTHPGEPLGGAAADSVPSDRRADGGRGYPGHSGSPSRHLQDPDLDALLDLPELAGLRDRLRGLSGSLQDWGDRPGGGPRHHHHPGHSSGRDAADPYPSSSDPATGRPSENTEPGSREPSGPANGSGASGADGSVTPPQSSAPSLAPSSPSHPPSSGTGASPHPSARPKTSPSHRTSDLAGGAGRRPYERMPEQTPAPSEELTGSEPDATDAGPAAQSPYALDAPAARVERVLPMGAGLALTGLGFAFLGLRLRRR